MISLDGYFTGPKENLDWHNVDEEFNKFAVTQLTDTETLVFGRITYEMMAEFWTSDYAKQTDPVTANLMNTKPKIVVSHSLKHADWNNTKLIKSNFGSVIFQLKQRSKKDIGILGSSNLSVSFLKLGLIDEFRIMVNPVILGSGRSIFEGTEQTFKIKLANVREFKSGNVLLSYEKP